MAAPPTTYLWRACCLDKIHAELAQPDGIFDGHQGRYSRYHTGFLRDAINLTIEPPARSRAAKAGLRYIQYYSSCKEIGDAQTNHLFSNSKLEDLGLDPDAWAAIGRQGSHANLGRRPVLLHNYTSAKERTLNSYEDSKRISFGIRMEARFHWRVLVAMRDLQRDRSPRPSLATRPAAVWAIPTEQFTRFMVGNYHKYCSTLEMVVATSPRTGIELGATRLVTVLVKCLQRFESSEVSREGVLWFDHREQGGTVRRGLGFETTMDRYGYAWYRPIVDWQRLRFRTEVAEHLVGVDRGLRGTFRPAVRQIQDTGEAVNVCLARLAVLDLSSGAAVEIARLLAHFCLRQFRRDVLDALNRAPAERGQKTKDGDKVLIKDWDKVQFSRQGLVDALGTEPHRMNKNRTSVKDPAELFAWLWGQSDRRQTHFVGKPYRLLHQKVQAAYRARSGQSEAWERMLYNQFWMWHPLVPYPDGNGTLLSTTKGSKGSSPQRQWWAVVRSGNQWAWDRGVAPRDVELKPYPAALDMSVDEFTRHLDQLVRTT